MKEINVPGVDVPLDDLGAPVKDDGGDPDPAQEFHEGAGNGPYRDRFHGQPEKPLIFLGESGVFIMLHAERLDNPVA